MPGWETVVELLRQSLFVLAHHMDGSMGAAIFVVSAVARLLILPLTVRAALAAREHQAKLALLAPELARIKRLHGSDARRVAEATSALYGEHGISALPHGTLLTMAVQFPIGAALYAAIRSGLTVGQRFLWVADLAKPDFGMTAAVGALAAVSAWAAGMTQPTPATPAGMSTYTMAAVSGLMTVLFAFRLASGVGIYWAASSVVGLVQPVIVRRIVRAQAR